MKQLIYRFFTLVTAVFLTGCVDETYYQENKDCNLIEFSIKGQIANSIVTGSPSDTGFVFIGMPLSADLSNLEVNEVKLSPLAKCDKDLKTIRNFTKDISFKLTAEDNAVSKIWIVRVAYQDAPRQLPFADMKQWTPALNSLGNPIQTNGTSAYFPGNGIDFSPWQHAARANQMNFFFTVNPMPDVTNPQYACMETKFYNGGASMGFGIVTGAIFTGIFRYDPQHLPALGSDPNPRKMVDFGTPFYYKPTAIRFKMRYKAGDIMRDGHGNEVIGGKDSCDIYIILQNRSLNENVWYRVGAAWLRTSEATGNFNDANGFTEIILPIVYGEPSASVLNEKPYMAIGGTQGEVVFYRFVPIGDDKYDKIQMEEQYGNAEMNVDNIIITFSSSAYGDLFLGAPDSRLDIRDIEFVY
ncbi:MAG: PCMD domain-containing protein [Bacteroidales bacterium]|jgi:hypothetical protein|nr:PCMD domain-containing protein [Bacteroidales bacterium]